MKLRNTKLDTYSIYNESINSFPDNNECLQGSLILLLDFGLY